MLRVERRADRTVVERRPPVTMLHDEAAVLPFIWWQAYNAAPSAVPLSPAAGWMKSSRNPVCSRILPLATLFIAHPPAKQSRVLPVDFCTCRSTWRAARSNATCRDAAIASCFASSGSSRRRAGPSNDSSFGVKTAPSVGSPSSHVIWTPSDQCRK
jgi:hypothetical protein